VQLFLERPVAVVADQDVEAVAVDRERQAVLPEDLVEDDGVAVEIFGGAEGEGEELGGGVVDGAQEVMVGPRPSSQSKGLPSIWMRVPLAASRRRRPRCGRGRRRRLAGCPAARRSRRTEARLMVRWCSSCNFSVRWTSLRPGRRW